MNNLGTLVILIGKNGSGKSNILEALDFFFSNLDLRNDKNQGEIGVYNWHNRESSNPIEFILRIEFTNQELESLIQPEVMKNLRKTDQLENNRVEIHSRLVDLGDHNQWVHHRISISGIVIRGDDSVSSLIKVLKGIGSPKTFVSFTTERLTEILTKQFKLLRTSREPIDNESSPQRGLLISSTTESELINLATGDKIENESKWKGLGDDFRSVTGKNLTSRGMKLHYKNPNQLQIPVQYGGSGDQAITSLINFFHTRNEKIYGIEEPETRLHNEYVRKIFSLIERESQQRQIFIATHSSIFIDKMNLDNTWFVSLMEKETKVNRIQNDNLKHVMSDIGIQPSDFLFANRILFVEGETEVKIIPRIAEKSGIDISDLKIINLRGKSKGPYHLSLWSEIANNTDLPTFMLLDKNARIEASELIAGGKIKENCCHILNKQELTGCTECDIEDYYNREILKKAVEEFSLEYGYPNTPDINQLVLQSSLPVVKVINDHLRRDDWKVIVGEKVIERMTTEQVKEDMKEILIFLSDAVK